MSRQHTGQVEGQLYEPNQILGNIASFSAALRVQIIDFSSGCQQLGSIYSYLLEAFPPITGCRSVPCVIGALIGCASLQGPLVSS